jgi:predicted transcriptional regulator
MHIPDLTPFGFTPTETAAYVELLAAGPSSGYAVAKRLSMARANAYAALNGLVTKEAADVSGESPAIYRARQPQALLARITRDTAARLDTLERALGTLTSEAEPGLVRFSGEAEFGGILLRMAVRDPGAVSFLADAAILRATLPVWRAREANGRPSTIWCVGEPPGAFPVQFAGQVDASAVVDQLGGMLTIAVTGTAAMLAGNWGRGLNGYWTSEPVLLAAARGTLHALTS